MLLKILIFFEKSFPVQIKIPFSIWLQSPLIALTGDDEVNSKLKLNLVGHCYFCRWDCAQNPRKFQPVLNPTCFWRFLIFITFHKFIFYYSLQVFDFIRINYPNARSANIRLKTFSNTTSSILAIFFHECLIASLFLKNGWPRILPSLLVTRGNCFEKLIFKEMLKHFTNNELI